MIINSRTIVHKDHPNDEAAMVKGVNHTVIADSQSPARGITNERCATETVWIRFQFRQLG